jgi:hypothetical protein
MTDVPADGRCLFVWLSQPAATVDADGLFSIDYRLRSFQDPRYQPNSILDETIRRGSGAVFVHAMTIGLGGSDNNDDHSRSA